MNGRLIVSLALMGLVVLFTLQNTEVVQISFLFWTWSAPRALILFSVLAVGIILGWILHSLTHHIGTPVSSPSSKTDRQEKTA